MTAIPTPLPPGSKDEPTGNLLRVSPTFISTLQNCVSHSGHDPETLSEVVGIRVAVLNQLLSGRMWAPWRIYARILEECEATPQTRERIRHMYIDRHRDRDVPGDPPRNMDAKDSGLPPLTATSPAEFVGLLRRLMLLARLNPGQIAIKTSIARSQVYNMVKAGRTTLPTKLEQVCKFVEACGLAPHQIGRVELLWVELKENPHRALATPTPAPASEPPAPNSADLVQVINQLMENQRGPNPHRTFTVFAAVTTVMILAGAIAFAAIVVDEEQALSVFIVLTTVVFGVGNLIVLGPSNILKFIRYIRKRIFRLRENHGPDHGGRPEPQHSE